VDESVQNNSSELSLQFNVSFCLATDTSFSGDRPGLMDAVWTACSERDDPRFLVLIIMGPRHVADKGCCG